MQQQSHLLERLGDDIRRAYGPLASPSWGFVRKQHALAPYATVISELGRHVHVTDDTDLNYDVGPQLLLSANPESPLQWCLCLSYVGRYCALFRLSGSVVTPTLTQLSPPETAILQCLARHSVQALSQPVLEASFPMTGLSNNPSSSQVLVFHVLFSDAAQLPWRLSSDPTEA